MKRLTLAVAVAVGVMLAEAVWGQFDYHPGYLWMFTIRLVVW